MADCRSYRIRPRGVEPVTDPDANWLHHRTALEGLIDLDDGSALLPWSEATFPVVPGDVLLLCSDGLTEPVYGIPPLGPPEFARIVDLERPLSDSARRLIEEALRTDREHGEDKDRGGEDNVAFVLVRLGTWS